MACVGDELERVTSDEIVRHFSKKVLFPKGINDVQSHQMDKFVKMPLKDLPLF